MKGSSFPSIVTRPVSLQPLDAGAVLVDHSTGECFELNLVGVEIWKLLAAGESAAEIARKIALKYGVSEATVTSDLQALVINLQKHGLIEHPHQ